METVFIIIVFLLTCDYILGKLHKPIKVLHFHFCKKIFSYMEHTKVYKKWKIMEQEAKV